MIIRNANVLFSVNILFVLSIKSIASLFSILNIFSTEQVQYFFYVSSLSQLFFFCISLGHTSDKDFTFFSREQLLYVVLRLSALTVGLIIFDSTSIHYLFPAISFAILMVFNAFVDFRVKLYALYINSISSFLLTISITVIIVLSSFAMIEGRMLIQILPFFIYSLLIVFAHVSERKIWFSEKKTKVKLNKFIFIYALLTSVYTFLDRKYIAEFGGGSLNGIFLIINLFSLVVFFMDYFFKNRKRSNICFTYAILIYNVIAVLLIFVGYKIEVFYASVLFFQFFCFSFYVTRKNQSMITLLSVFFVIVCVLLTLGNSDVISFFYVYFMMYLSQIIFSIYFLVKIIPRSSVAVHK